MDEVDEVDALDMADAAEAANAAEAFGTAAVPHSTEVTSTLERMIVIMRSL
ncbi:hypothetical protein [Actinomadura logoneensis]|uniref:hypothetical protein n=1 Tax=Actinomadura logoneensis TaxID=2293572 RepID=UPI0013140E1B|nr:hypothetical protein [Actinomadura logoneensis]